MAKSMDIVALGECLIDFVSVKSKKTDKILLEGNAGGAPANTLAAAARLGRRTAYIGRVGRDSFGRFFRERLDEAGVDTAALVSGDEPTTLAMVTLDEKGDRSFGFYRNKTADIMLREYDVNMELVSAARIFHFGAVSLTEDPSRTATLAAASRAKYAGVKVSFDPNYRDFLWANKDDAVAAMREGIQLSDYVKMSEEEAELLTGESNPEKAALSLITRYDLTFAAVTLGPKGSVGVSSSARVRVPAYEVDCVDTTGAGDAFWGAALHQLLAIGGVPLTEKRIGTLLEYACACGSLTTTKHGAIAALPTDEQVTALIKTQRG